jgi:hypothetical protein
MQLPEFGITKDWPLAQLVSAEIPHLFAGTETELPS